MSLRSRALPRLLAVALTLAGAGCMVPKSRLDACHAFNCQLQRRNQEICGQYESLKVQNQDLANKNLDLEDQLAAQDELLARYEQRRGEWDREKDEWLDRVRAMGQGQSPLPSKVRYNLENFARQYPDFVEFDPNTGISKFKSDVLFDSGDATLQPDSARVLGEFARIFQDPSGRALQIMVVGHTDIRQIRRPETRARYETNWDLSTDRANSVVKYLQQVGIEPQRMGSVGYGPYQPIDAGNSAAALERNRRVEIFVLSPDTPMVGRTNQPGGY